MERFLFTKLFMLIMITLVLQMHGCKGCLEKERIALLKIKALIINASTVVVDDYNPTLESWIDDHNRTLESWVDNRASDCCGWYQVECNTTTGRVINLSLSRLLYRSTPILNISLFQSFEELQSLNLSSNYFEGCGDCRESLKQLKILDLGSNNFNSSILPYLTTLTSLKTLKLGGNNLGDFNTKQGAGLANLRNLEDLDLSYNRINGTLQELESLKQLKILDLGYNYFNSSILSYLTTLTSLRTLILRLNNLKDFNTKQGAELANLRKLEVLDLSYTRISGSTLQELESLKQLRILDLHWNNFNSSILQYLTRLTSLRTLILRRNYLEDFNTEQGAGLANLINLEVLDLSFNRINGTLPELESLKQLKILDLGYNNFNSSILPYLTRLTSLRTLILYNNNLEDFNTKKGAGLANLRNLEFLDLSENGISGTLQGLESLKQLKILDFSGNNFNSSILSYLTRLTSLRTLKLGGNNLGDFNTKQGAGLANLKNLEVLDLSFNYGLNGTLQELGAGLANLRNLKFLDLSYNGINGTLQGLGIYELKNLTELNLKWNNFEGHLPTCLNNLTNIRALDLSSNQLSGNISSDIQNLVTPLEYLSLEDNNFEGLFSFTSLANLSKLEIFRISTRNSTLQVLETENFLQPPNQLKVLYLSNCNLHAIPSFVMYQHSLRFIDLSHNKLVGKFPTWLLHNNTRLQGMNLRNNSFMGSLQLPNSTHDLLQLDISTNNMKGQLPKNIGTILPRLSYLNLSKNSFEGHIPSSMGEMKGLEKLDLSSNNFLGELPKSFISGCFSLDFLRLSNNNFHGEIFPEFMNMTRLNLLYLDNNKFSGKLQKGLLKALSLSVLDLSNNSFSGQIPHWIGNFSNLWALSMSNNLLEGGVPVQLSNIKGLEVLDISKNRLSGSIASSTNLSSVQYLYMQNNSLSGSIPNAFFRSSESIILDLRDNEFSGSIPNEIDDRLSNLQFLLLAGNHLEGYIPHELCRLQNVSILDLSHNKLNGTIPSCFTNMSFWLLESEDLTLSTEFYYGGSNSFSIASYNFTLNYEEYASVEASYGKLEVDFVTKNRAESYKGSILRYMTGIDLSSNKLTGDVPSEFGYLQKIHAMNLSHNSLSGSIPESFSHLKSIESLDLSHNKLSGRIPPQLIELNNLGTFNVTFNHLSGPVPDQGQFGTFVESSYRGNPGLCGSQIKRSCEPTASPASPSGAREEEDESAIDMVSFYWSFFASSVTTILGLVLILWLNSDWRRQWFYFIDECIIICHCWILRYVFRRYR